MDRPQHLAKASSFETFARSLDPDDAYDRPWIVIAKFYAALHYVDAFLAETGNITVTGHPDRRKLMRSYQQTRMVVRDYLSLEQASWRARYDLMTNPAQEMIDADRAFQAVRARMRTVLRLPP